jgi:hypothetical protein
MSKQEVGRPLTEAQRQHLMQLIADMRVSSARLEASKTIMEAQIESAQKEFDAAQMNANAFLRYCGLEHKITFDDGQWRFDEQLMCFVRNLPLESIPNPNHDVVVGPEDVREVVKERQAQPNGTGG